MTPQELLDKLSRVGELKGHYLHADKEHCLDIAKSLLECLEKHGYMNCPCRLAKEDKKLDADIICPCIYREEDIRAQGACFCLLFVSEEHKDNVHYFPEVDDRRPDELASLGLD